MMRGTRLLLAAALGAALAPTPAGADIGCPPRVCSGNGIVMYGQDIHGFNVNGEANADGHRLVIDSIRLRSMAPWWPPGYRHRPLGSACRYFGDPSNLRLRVVANRLEVYVSGAPAGQAQVFTGQCLRGATFTVSINRTRATAAASRVAPVVLRIVDIGQTPTWHQVSTARKPLEMYRIVPLTRDPDVLQRDQSSICERKDARWMESWQVLGVCEGLPCGAGPQGTKSLYEASDMALVASGDVYGEEAGSGLKVLGQQEGPDWFQFACAGSSMSKLIMMGFDLSKPDERPLRFATLNMLAASYDGKGMYTRSGTPLEYALVNGPAFVGGPLKDTVFGELEAYWGPSGAMCLSHLRTWRKRAGGGEGYEGPGTAPGTEAEHRGQFNLPSCDPPPPGAMWKTFPVDHITH